MSNAAIHCPLCNTNKVMGLGLVMYELSTLVEYRCRGCGEIFLMDDKRKQLVTRADGMESSQCNRSDPQ